MVKKFPVITLEGNPQEIGFQHGSTCRSLIEKNISFYDNLFNLEKTKLKYLSNHYKEEIFAFNPNYTVEIEAIAEGKRVGYYHSIKRERRRMRKKGEHKLNKRKDLLLLGNCPLSREVLVLCYTIYAQKDIRIYVFYIDK